MSSSAYRPPSAQELEVLRQAGEHRRLALGGRYAVSLGQPAVALHVAADDEDARRVRAWRRDIL
jgi:hypothetical protein